MGFYSIHIWFSFSQVLVFMLHVWGKTSVLVGCLEERKNCFAYLFDNLAKSGLHIASSTLPVPSYSTFVLKPHNCTERSTSRCCHNHALSAIFFLKRDFFFPEDLIRKDYGRKITRGLDGLYTPFFQYSVHMVKTINSCKYVR